MIEHVNSLRIGGVLTLWKVADLTRRSVLKDLLCDAGFDKFVPEPRPPAGALRDALEEVCGGPRVLVRPLKTKDGFAVVTEERGDEHSGNRYDISLTARINPDSRAIRFNPLDERASKVAEAFNRNLGLLRQHQVSAALVSVILHLGGTTHLRDTGGIYWLPDTRLDDWRRVAAAVEASAYDRASSVYLFLHQMDADAIRAVRDAICAEVASEAKAIQEEIVKGDLGQRALENRRLAAEALRDKIGLYEGLLGVGLDEIRNTATEAAVAAAAAVLLSASQVEDEVPA